LQYSTKATTKHYLNIMFNQQSSIKAGQTSIVERIGYSVETGVDDTSAERTLITSTKRSRQKAKNESKQSSVHTEAG